MTLVIRAKNGGHIMYMEGRKISFAYYRGRTSDTLPLDIPLPDPVADKDYIQQLYHTLERSFPGSCVLVDEHPPVYAFFDEKSKVLRVATKANQHLSDSHVSVTVDRAIQLVHEKNIRFV